VLSLLRGETSAAEAARKHGLTVAQVEEWWELLLAGAENGLRSRPVSVASQDFLDNSFSAHP
jgi:hypothetical protein